MIELKKYQEKYYDGLKDLCSRENLPTDDLLKHLDSTYIVTEKDQVYGFAYYSEKEGDTYLDHLYISKDQRRLSFGDGLFRTLLNALMLQGCFKVYIKDQPIYKDFLRYEDIPYEDGRYVIDLNEFFNRKCKSRK